MVSLTSLINAILPTLTESSEKTTPSGIQETQSKRTFWVLTAIGLIVTALNSDDLRGGLLFCYILVTREN